MATQYLVEEDDAPVEGPSPSLIPTEDGGAIIDLDGEMPEDEPGIETAEWDANLAELLSDDVLRKIGGEVIDNVKADDDSREEWKQGIKTGMDLLVHINPEGVEKDINPFTHGSAIHTDIMKTEGLKQALDQ